MLPRFSYVKPDDANICINSFRATIKKSALEKYPCAYFHKLTGRLPALSFPKAEIPDLFSK